ncbi:MAG: SH3 domain-containing protein [Solibacteraceae bacterium]|nr:SH3 domain-containing protein [Solibacteraceae bacterium]
MTRPPLPRTLLAAAATLLLGACSSQPDRAPSLGEAFVGPARLQLRAALVSGAETVAQLEHGDRVEIVGRRRRFLRVRTNDGAEGWLDSSQLLGPHEMDELRQLAARAAQHPSQGSATVFDLLNVHTAPNRQAPSFFQLTPDIRAAVITHQRAPRVPFDPPRFLQELFRPSPAAARARKPKKQPEIPPPPPGPPPALPKDWISLSHGAPALKTLPPPKPKPAPPPPSGPTLESWTLVRAADGRTGWVLASLLYLAIPEEVAQYAERARITSYHPLGQVAARSGELKTVWLWTTLSARNVDYHFDNLRVFTWNTRRQRYETAHIERNIKGYLPLRLHGVENSASGWDVLIENRAGALERVHYLWDGSRVRISSREPASLPGPWYSPPDPAGDPEADSGPDSETAPSGRLNQLFRSLRDRFSR